MKEKLNPAVTGIPMRWVHFVTFAVVFILSVLIVLTSWRIMDGYNLLRANTDEYISRHADADNMQAASDYLTSQARSFAYTGDRQYLDNYFNEANVTQRRDQALANMRDDLGADSDSYRELSAAMSHSVALMELEYYSMRLTIGAKGYSLSEYPEEVQRVVLEPEDWSLSPEEKEAKAMDLLFGVEYMTAKQNIQDSVMACLSKILDNSESKQLASSQLLLSQVWNLVGLIVLLLLFVFVSTFLSFRLIYRPLHQSMKFVERDQPIPEEGSSEIRTFARTYNVMFRENGRRKAELRFDATHDALTGLYNRKAYEDIFRALDKKTVSLILVDVDGFKSFNDTYGHETGDKVLTKVAYTLRGRFRSDDFICRIGGDEFAIIMTNASSSLRNMVEDKIQMSNEILQAPKDGLPPISISAGVAFGDSGMTDTMFNAADAALYEAKRRGRNGCCFAE